MVHDLAGVTVINDIGLAEQLIGIVPLVVLRPGCTGYEPTVQDYKHVGADPRIIMQFGNEANQPYDNDHWLRQMYDADADGGRKVVIYNDSVGWTEDDVWLRRRPSWEYAFYHGHYIGLHAYGITTDGDRIYHPMTELSGFRYFAGRCLHLYELMGVKPNLILTECGAGGFQQNAGSADVWFADVSKMDSIANAHPWLKSFHWWDYSREGMGFDRDLINEWVWRLK